MKKFKSSVTDSEDEIRYDLESKIGISNLIDIYSSVKGISHKEVEKKFSSSKYGEFKIEVGEAVSNYLEPIFSKYDSSTKTSRALLPLYPLIIPKDSSSSISLPARLYPIRNFL